MTPEGIMTEFDKECLARVEACQRKQREEQEAWNAANAESILSMKEKLTGIGGSRVSPQIFIELPFVLKLGEYMNLPVTLRRMEPSRCHDNVSKLWLTRKPKGRLKKICFGYGLTKDDGMWRPHSWGLIVRRGGFRILETTVIRDAYFGVIMNEKAATYWATGD